MQCPDCLPDPLDRREFLRTPLAGAAVTALPLAAAPARTESETLVATLYKTLTPEQRSVVCMPFDHPLRSKVDNNWFITPKKIGEFFSPDQQAMIGEIFRG